MIRSQDSQDFGSVNIRKGHNSLAASKDVEVKCLIQVVIL
jgi:hypothetical protein